MHWVHAYGVQPHWGNITIEGAEEIDRLFAQKKPAMRGQHLPCINEAAFELSYNFDPYLSSSAPPRSGITR